MGPGSAGASTLAVALATQVKGLLLEADADGGVMAARYSGWLDEQAPSLESLLASVPTYGGVAAMAEHLQKLPGGARAALTAPDAERALDSAQALAEDLEHLRRILVGETLVIDVGRVRPDSPALMLAEQSDALIAVIRPEIDALHCLMARLPLVREQIPRLLVAVRGDGPYDLDDIRAAVARRAGAPVAVVGVPEDPGGVQALHRGRSGWSGLTGRSSAGLMPAARVLAMLLNGPAPGEEWPVTQARYP